MIQGTQALAWLAVLGYVMVLAVFFPAIVGGICLLSYYVFFGVWSLTAFGFGALVGIVPGVALLLVIFHVCFNVWFDDP